jgi:hypothetical protein
LAQRIACFGMRFDQQQGKTVKFAVNYLVAISMAQCASLGRIADAHFQGGRLNFDATLLVKPGATDFYTDGTTTTTTHQARLGSI